jgi:hypothetical protein
MSPAARAVIGFQFSVFGFDNGSIAGLGSRSGATWIQRSAASLAHEPGIARARLLISIRPIERLFLSIMRW